MKPAGLPTLLQEIAAAAGVQAAYDLVRARGGQRVYIPAPDKLGPEHWLVRACGAQAARAIAAHFSVGDMGCDVKLPLGSGSSYLAEQRAREQALQAAIDAGRSVNDIVREVGVDRSSVFRAKERFARRRNRRQGDLF